MSETNNPANTPGEMDEWDALQAQIEAEANGASGRKPTEAELKRAADDFLRQHKDDLPSDAPEEELSPVYGTFPHRAVSSGGLSP